VITSAGHHRVVITGMGAVTPLGAGVDRVWSRLIKGESAMGPISRFDAQTFSTNFAAESEDVDLADRFAEHERHASAGRHARFALAAAAEAWKQAGLGDPMQPRGSAGGRAEWTRKLEGTCAGIYFAAGEGVPDFEAFTAANLAAWDAEKREFDARAWAETARERMSAIKEIEQEPNKPMQHIANAFGLRGPAFNSLTACAASTQAIGEATEILRRGDAEMMVSGGAHSMIHPLGITGFIRLTALSSRRDDPERASRPFSADRDGFVMGDGAGVVILETLDHALARGAAPLAEIVGFGSSADAYRITDIEPEGRGAYASMLEALADANLDPRGVGDDGRPDIHYISAHGTGTKENDSIETRGLKSVFGELAGKIPVSSVKSMMGHLIAAAGAVELITCVKAIETGVVPPTINLDEPDSGCDLDYVPNEARDLSGAGGVRTALSNGFGFGGQNDTLIVRRYEG